MELHPTNPATFDVVFRNAWMQKHPTPSHGQSDFHWHPGDIPARIRVALSELLTRYRSERASVWLIGADFVAWAQLFSDTAPGERRRYTGLTTCIAQPQQASWRHAIPEIFANLRPPPPTPWTAGSAASTEPWRMSAPARPALPDELSEPAPPAPSRRAPTNPPSGRAPTGDPNASAPLALLPARIDGDQLTALCDPSQIAQAVYLGGPARAADPYHADLPTLLGRLLTWLPTEEGAHTRSGAFRAQQNDVEVSASTNRGLVNLLHYLSRAWLCPESIHSRDPGFPERAWLLVLELSASLGRSLPDLLDDLGRVAAAWDTTDDLRTFLLTNRILSRKQINACDSHAPRPLFAESVPDAGFMWNRLMHYWGRALLPVDDQELMGLARLLAQRIAVDHLFHLDAPDRVGLPRRYLRRLAYESLLPKARLDVMIHALAHYAPSLFRPLEVPFG